jgi:hypothetical protein
MTTPALLPAVEFDPPLVNPAPNGLFPVVSWTEVGDAPSRFLGEGVRVRTINYGGEDSTGVWGAPWCGVAKTVLITGAPTGGTFTLTYDGQTTSTIAFNASAATVQTALEALSNLEVGEVTVTGDPGGPYTVALAVDGTLTGSGAGLTGGTTPAVVVADEVKEGDRPVFPDPFAPITAWAYDQCDLTAASRQEVRDNAAQWLRLMEQTDVEHALALRMLADAGVPDTASDIVGALGHLEGLLAVTNTVGVIHASATWAVSAAQASLIRYTGGGPLTPMGHRWVFGGGYVDGLADTLVATSQVFGWRDAPQIRETVEAKFNQFVAIAERSFAVGYESVVGAVDVTG